MKSHANVSIYSQCLNNQTKYSQRTDDSIVLWSPTVNMVRLSFQLSLFEVVSPSFNQI